MPARREAVKLPVAMTEREIHDGAVLRRMLGFDLPVADLPALVATKLASWSHPRRRPNKRREDEWNLLRLAEAFPDTVIALLPESLRRQAEADRAEIEAYPEGDGWGRE